MKQIFQNISNGETTLEEVPCPSFEKGSLLISTRNSVVSAGTERSLVDFGKANIIDKGRQQPDKVKQVLDKVKTDGLITTFDAVRSKLNQPLPLGYCNAGVVLESDIDGFKKGDRVISNGPHAEVVRVPVNLCAKIPDSVDYESASFTVLAAIGLQGIRLIKPTLGETVVVSGLGLVGLMIVQMLKANGCRVLGIDFDSYRCEMAKKFGAETVDLSKGEDPIAVSMAFSRGRGADAIIIAAASQSDTVIHQAAQMCRKRGRIVLVGVVGLNLRRDDFFKKEITFQVSASYGPGRYDPQYEVKGNDYPIGFVRWTEQRNFEAVLDMMASGKLNIKPLITHRFSIDKASDAYKILDKPSALGILLQYSNHGDDNLRKQVLALNSNHIKNDNFVSNGKSIVGFIGAGNYASRVLIPAFKKAGAEMEVLISSSGVSSAQHGRKAGFRFAATDLDVLFKSKKINTIAIATRHDLHASQVISAIKAGKNVFVEKPLALTIEQLSMINEMMVTSKNLPILMVGFNRRFAPHIKKMKALLDVKSEPKVIVITVNAGAIPADHWTHDKLVGGGRIIGEGCHFIDLMRFLIGHPIIDHKSMMMGETLKEEIINDKVTINLSFEDGSFGAIHYLANGGSNFAKERIEVFSGGATLQLDNFRILKGYSWPGFKSMRLFKQDKGQFECAKIFVNAVQMGKSSPIPYDELMECSRIAIEIADSLGRKS